MLKRTIVIIFISLVGFTALLTCKDNSPQKSMLSLTTVKRGTDTLSIVEHSVDLTEEGTLDWSQWGYGADEWIDPYEYNHKAGVEPLIVIDTIILKQFIPDGQKARAFKYEEPTGNQFSWSDGTPSTTVKNFDAGLWIPGIGNGFRITVPADKKTHILKLHLGVWRATGYLSASLSDGSVEQVKTSLSSYSQGYSTLNVREYIIEYAANADDEELTVTWLVGDHQDPDGWGNVTLRAAILTE